MPSRESYALSSNPGTSNSGRVRSGSGSDDEAGVHREKKKISRRTSQIIVVIVIIALLVGVGVALYFVLRPSPYKATATTATATPTLPAATEQPIDQPKESGVVIPCPKYNVKHDYDQASCEKQTKFGCVWRDYEDKNIPKCVQQLPISSDTIWDIQEVKDANTQSLTQFDLSKGNQKLRLDIKCRTTNVLQVKIYDPAKQRFEIPTEALPISDSSSECGKAIYSHELIGQELIIRHEGVKLFSMTLDSRLVFEEQFLQTTIALNSSTNYGFGEHNHRRLMLDMNYKTWAIYTRDVAPVDEWNLYGAQPYFMSIRPDIQSAMGVFLKNSHAMDVFLQPDPHPAVTYRVIGGVFDFHIVFAENPEKLTEHYTNLVGRSLLPPYWSLGFQLSRWGYTDLDHVKRVVDRNREAGIPLDVLYGDIDYMRDKLIFTYDTDKFRGLPQYVDELRSNGTRYVIILDPGVGIEQEAINKLEDQKYNALVEGVQMDVFIKESNGSNLVGRVWPGDVYFPDFTNPNTTIWWKNEIWDFYNNSRNISYAGVKFDGLWIDMNEPSNFRDGKAAEDVCDMTNKLNSPPYIPDRLLGNSLVDKTICMDSVQHWGRHYDVHSLYGHSMAMSTYNALAELFPTERPFVLTRSTFSGSNRHAIHWLGDNQSQWRQVPWSIVAMLEFSMFGFPMTGSDICGFWYNTTEEMCQRWMQLGAFYPYSRNHNAGYNTDEGFLHMDQDPANFGEEMVKSSRDVLLTRYKLLPYLYTLMYRAHSRGSTVARPLFFEFPEDVVTHSIDRQFLWGPALLISPVLEEGKTSVNAYIPSGVWYDYYTRAPISSTKKWLELESPLDKINLHVRGGYVIPWQQPSHNTDESKKKSFGLLVALDEKGESEGELYIDDGVSLNPEYSLISFKVSSKKLGITHIILGYTNAPNMKLSTIEISGVKERTTHVYIDGVRTENFTYDSSTQMLVIRDDQLSLKEEHEVTWSAV